MASVKIKDSDAKKHLYKYSTFETLKDNQKYRIPSIEKFTNEDIEHMDTQDEKQLHNLQLELELNTIHFCENSVHVNFKHLIDQIRGINKKPKKMTNSGEPDEGKMTNCGEPEEADSNVKDDSNVEVDSKVKAYRKVGAKREITAKDVLLQKLKKEDDLRIVRQLGQFTLECLAVWVLCRHYNPFTMEFKQIGRAHV